MTTQDRNRWLNKRLLFVAAAMAGNVVLVVLFLLPVSQNSSPAQQVVREEEPLLFKKLIQQTLAKETVEQLIEHLPDFDDTVPNKDCVGNTYTHPHSYGYSVRFYPNLNRVRKILEEGRDKPDRATPILKKKLVHLMDDYKRVAEEYIKDFDSEDPVVNTRRNELEKRRITASSAIYVLAQLKVHDALPAMEKLFIAQSDMFKPSAVGEEPLFSDVYCIVNRVFLFYAMHHLVRDHPRGNLSPEALKRLNEYLEASKQIPEYKEKSVPSWRATYDSWDYRIAILGKDMGMDKQPHIKVNQFPMDPSFYFEDLEGTPDAKVLAWFGKMKLFIDAAYPSAAKLAPKPKEASSP